MESMIHQTPIPSAEQDLKDMDSYVEDLKRKGFEFNVAVADTFIESIREIGYRDTGYALDEEIDNSIQAAARNVHVALGYYPENKNRKKIDEIAIIDDGHGMRPEMIRAAVVWGGSHRAHKKDRSGFGRFGFGLPSSCVSQGRRFTVYSKIQGGSWHSVSVDLNRFAEEYEAGRKLVVEEPKKATVPKWILEYYENNRKRFKEGWESGTIVVIDKLDKVAWSTTQKMQERLKEHFGLIYRFYLRTVGIFVDGVPVDPVDPLFITPGFRYYESYPSADKKTTVRDEDRAEARPELEIPVKDKRSGDVAGVIKVRFAYLPPTFARFPESKKWGARGINVRWSIIEATNGILFLRAGRQIEVVSAHCPWTKFQNYDAYLKIEVDFPPTLDEDFSITTHKQQVVPSERMWDILEQHGVFDALREMRRRQAADIAKLKTAKDETEKRMSEQAMEEIETFRRSSPSEGRRLEEGKKALKEHAQRKSKETGKGSEEIEKESEEAAAKRQYLVVMDDAHGGLFYEPEQFGAQLRIHLNPGHRFFKDLYASSASNPLLRNALEVMLFVLGVSEVSAKDEIRNFYKSERYEWSRFLDLALARLEKMANLSDEEASLAESGNAHEASQARKTNTSVEN